MQRQRVQSAGALWRIMGVSADGGRGTDMCVLKQRHQLAMIGRSKFRDNPGNAQVTMDDAVW